MLCVLFCPFNRIEHLFGCLITITVRNNIKVVKIELSIQLLQQILRLKVIHPARLITARPTIIIRVIGQILRVHALGNPIRLLQQRSETLNRSIEYELTTPNPKLLS